MVYVSSKLGKKDPALLGQQPRRLRRPIRQIVPIVPIPPEAAGGRCARFRKRAHLIVMSNRLPRFFQQSAQFGKLGPAQVAEQPFVLLVEWLVQLAEHIKPLGRDRGENDAPIFA